MSEKPAPDPTDTDAAATSRPETGPAALSSTVGTQAQHQAPVFPSPTGLPAVPGYTVTCEVARGGMGVVYAAHDPTLDREVAVKVMHAGQDEHRFVIESKVTASCPTPASRPSTPSARSPTGARSSR